MKISTSDLKILLDGITVSGTFIETRLGVKSVERVKRGLYWEEAQWPAIKAALVKFIKSLPDEVVLPSADDGLGADVDDGLGG